MFASYQQKIIDFKTTSIKMTSKFIDFKKKSIKLKSKSHSMCQSHRPLWLEPWSKVIDPKVESIDSYAKQ